MCALRGKRPHRAIVVGGGVGGLAAAHVLRRTYPEVVIVERDVYPEQPVARRGVPQGRCLHMLLGAGQRSLERLVSGFGEALTRAGATPFDVGEQGAVRLGHGWLPRECYGVSLHAASRALIEHVLRERVLGPGIEVAAEHRASGLRVNARGAVTGVHGDGPSGAFELEGAVTVVATGSGSVLPRWLDAQGLGAAPVHEVRTGWRYVSRWYEPPTDIEVDWRLLSIGPTPAVARGGMIFEAEGRCWGAVLVLPEDEPSPRTDAQFVRMCESLADPSMARALTNAIPQGPIEVHRAGANRWHRFDQMPTWPKGLVAVGDAVASLDPYFGLGMSACLRGVEALAEVDWARPEACGMFMKELGRRIEWPWRLATEQFATDDRAQVHLRRSLVRLVVGNAALARVLVRRMHMLDPPDVFDRGPARALLLAAAGAS